MALTNSMLLLGFLAIMVDTVIGEDCLASANSYRRKHENTVDFEWDTGLATQAQAYAEKLLANGGNLEHYWIKDTYENNANAGENLAYRLSDEAGDDGSHCREADNRWYGEINNYDWETGLTKGGVIGHFTQMVWAGSTKVGYGVAVGRSPKQYNPNTVYTIRIVVARYVPAGNTAGQFLQNVHELRPVQPTPQPIPQPTEGNGDNGGSDNTGDGDDNAGPVTIIKSGFCKIKVTKEVCQEIAKEGGIEYRQIVNNARAFPSGCYRHMHRHRNGKPNQRNDAIYYNEKPTLEPCTEGRYCMCRKV